MIVTTTNTIEGYKIDKYYEIVSANIVLGTNFFSDFGASITDLFGGFSDSYQNKLKIIYKSAIDEIREKAYNLSANAIIGLKIDFDEISGKGKSMFMVSAIGTPVKIESLLQENSHINNSEKDFITNSKLEIELKKELLIQKVKNNYLPNENDWYFLLHTPIDSIFPILFNKYLEDFPQSEIENSKQLKNLLNNFPQYLSVIDKDKYKSIIYDSLDKNPRRVIDLINSNNLFSALDILKLLNEGNFGYGIPILNSEKGIYTVEDLVEMKTISDLLQNLPDKGKIEDSKGLMGKSKQKYICPNGHKNSVEEQFCSSYNCGLNIKGFKKSQQDKIDKFLTKVDILQQNLENCNLQEKIS